MTQTILEVPDVIGLDPPIGVKPSSAKQIIDVSRFQIPQDSRFITFEGPLSYISVCALWNVCIKKDSRYRWFPNATGPVRRAGPRSLHLLE